jgi:putative redox protein
MVRIDAVYEGDLHTSGHHIPSGARLSTDAPVDNQGRGESFSPTDLLTTALGSCMLTVMGIVARREGWALEGARLAMEKHMSEGPRRVSKVVLRFEMPAGLPPASHPVLEQAARSCPVAQSVHPGIDVNVHFEWEAGARESSEA